MNKLRILALLITLQSSVSHLHLLKAIRSEAAAAAGLPEL